MPKASIPAQLHSWARRALSLGALVLLPVLPAGAAPPGAGGWAPGELLVGFHAGVPDSDAEATYRTHGAAKLEHLRNLRIHRIRAAPGADLADLEQKLKKKGQVAFVERNRRLPWAFLPNDPAFPSQWHLPAISAPQAWDLTQGSPTVIIAILDSGVDAGHPDLAGTLVPGYNFFDGNANTADIHGHGTRVAGAAAAAGNNGIGVAGVALHSRLMPIRVSDAAGWAYYSTIANGLTWAVDSGARVMNISFGGVAASNSISSAASYVRSRGGVVVAAAGNCGCWDATAENSNLISVSATDGADNLAGWSSQGNYVDLSAPGVSILTTERGGSYAYVSGTSFSSPITAGIVALMMAANPALSPTQLETLLKANADDRGSAGWDPQFGHGRVNAFRAVSAAGGSVTPPDTTPPTASITSPASGVTVSGTVAVAVAASDATGVSRVDLYIDGVLHASDSTSPYTFSWDTAAASNGPHTLVAKAYDAAGNEGVSAPVTVTVSNGGGEPAPDTTPPTVRIVSVVKPSKNRVTVSVEASDNVAVVRVDLYVDGRLVASKTLAPYVFHLNPNSYGPGTHWLEARASDAAGNTGTTGARAASFTK